MSRQLGADVLEHWRDLWGIGPQGMKYPYLNSLTTNGFTGFTDGSLQLDVLWHVPLPSFALQESPMARANHLLSPKVVATESASIVMRDILNMVKSG